MSPWQCQGGFPLAQNTRILPQCHPDRHDGYTEGNERGIQYLLLRRTHLYIQSEASIDDGFLAPYKVLRVGLDKDLEGWRPTAGQRDIYGYEIDDREYNTKDYDKNLIIDERTIAVAKCITRFLKENDRFAKTIVFCVDIDHAERMQQALVNENSDLVAENAKYVMRITGDNTEGKAQLDYFIAEDTPYALRELVKAIYIEAPDKSSGKRHQGIRISYDLVGFIPVEELLKQEAA